MKKLGFTLAEVLITLVIIGVIAALTLGTVVSNTSKKQFESQTQKFYSQFTKAIELYMIDNNIEKFADGEDFDPDEFAFTYLKVSSKCDVNCFAETYTSRTGPELSVALGDPIYKLADGSVLCIGGKVPFKFYFDSNGTKKPNKARHYLWVASVHVDGRLDSGFLPPDVIKSSSASEIAEIVQDDYDTYCSGEHYSGCFSYFIRNGFKIED